MNINSVLNDISSEKRRLLNHSLYANIKTVDDLHAFLECHVYAVWDFMSLLKALQRELTCVTTPWFASPNPEMRYLINEIVLAEESDVAITGDRKSHFEMYIDAMKACGADTVAIERFVNAVQLSGDIFTAIENSELSNGIKEFLQFTFSVIAEAKPHNIAAAFTFGREELIPEMFTEILKNLEANFPEISLQPLIYYFERHILLDADEHGPMAMKMIDNLCGNDPQKWSEVTQTAKTALDKRLGLWDDISVKIDAIKWI